MASCSRNYFGKLQGMKLPPNTYVHIESNESKRMTVAMYQDQNSKTKICTTSKTHTSVKSFRNDYSRSLSHCCSYLQPIWFLTYPQGLQESNRRLWDAISTVLIELSTQEETQVKKQHQANRGESKDKI